MIEAAVDELDVTAPSRHRGGHAPGCGPDDAARRPPFERSTASCRHLEGEIDMSNAASSARRSRPRPGDAVAVVLDLSGVDYLDSAGIHVVYELRERLGAAGRRSARRGARLADRRGAASTPAARAARRRRPRCGRDRGASRAERPALGRGLGSSSLGAAGDPRGRPRRSAATPVLGGNFSAGPRRGHSHGSSADGDRDSAGAPRGVLPSWPAPPAEHHLRRAQDIVMLRPSRLGRCSMMASSVSSSARRSRIICPRSGCVTSRPGT